VLHRARFPSHGTLARLYYPEDVFVERRNGSLWLPGERERPFRFVLVNAYYLQEEAARDRLDLVDETLAAARAMGATVVRAWAFNDDPNKADTGIQRAPRVYSERGLHGLDVLLARARAHGLRLLLPLVNHWNAYGGARQWLLWHGVADAQEGDSRFFTDGRVRDHYAAHVEHLLTRHNPLTGLRYADDPTVLGWELMNEPRGRGLPAGVLAGWVRFAAGCVKRAAPRQLVSVGDEGEEASFAGYDAAFFRAVGGGHLFAPDNGGSFSSYVECPDVDLASCHFYPQKYGLRPGSEREAGEAWIEQHARIAARAGKPLVVGEFGIANGGLPDELRAEIYRAWLRAARRSRVAGIGPWLFAYRSRPAAWDEFTFYDDDPIAGALRSCAEELASEPVA
jgi:mannan endo-1,4-beta-mannosidase